MISYFVNLPHRFSLYIKSLKRHEDLNVDPLLPDMGRVLRAKKGSKISRFFRIFFENERVKNLFGANLAALLIFSSLLPKTDNIASVSDNLEISSTVVLTTEHGVQYPVNPLKINQGYSLFHPGLDLGGNVGEPIHPIMTGIVEQAGYTRIGYGNVIIINHGNDMTSLYAHLSKIEVNPGQKVDESTEIGKIGETGHATGPHLHLEIRDHGLPINPLGVLPKL